MNEVAPQRDRERRTLSLASMTQTFLVLLPIAAVVVFYLLIVDTATVFSGSELADARFGLPFDWVEMDLSRYQQVVYPTTIGFDWQRAWHDPIATNYDWVVLAVNTGIVSAVLTCCLRLVMLALPRRVAKKT